MLSDKASSDAVEAYRRAQARLRIYDAKLVLRAVIDTPELESALSMAQRRRLLEWCGGMESVIRELGGSG
jgi:hypothetical protein